MTTIKKEKRDLIITQALSEIGFARRFKQGKVGNWKINEDLYYGRKVKGEEARANVDLGQMSSFAHTILSKIDNPLTVKFSKRKESQLKRVEMLNALVARDSQEDNWDIKDITGKKQAVIYGRAIYSYFADSEYGYCPHLENIDVYDFLVDPAGGGIDLEKAMYMGNYGVVKTRKEIEEGVKNKTYLKDEARILLEGTGNSTDTNQEQINKQNRTNDNNTSFYPSKDIGNPDVYKFWNWVTTYEGERYFLLLSEMGATAIEVCLLKDKFESNLFPYWSWAAFPDLTEFWTPSFCDYVREIFMAQAVSINQMLDNAEQINKPQVLIDVGAFEDLSQIKYRKNGRIEAKAGTDLSKAYQRVETPSINTPIQVFTLLDGIQEKASGVTAAAKGVAENDSTSKATIYKGNMENTADRFGYLNKSYAFGYKRFASLYEWGVKEHLIQKVAIDILGPNGIEAVEVSRRQIFRKNEKFNVSVEASNAELALSEAEKQAKLDFLIKNTGNAIQNQKKAYEIEAGIVGFEPDVIKELQDTDNFGNAGIMSEAMRDIEQLIDGEDIPLNQGATTAYKQRFVDYMQDQQEKLKPDQFQRLLDYIAKIDSIIVRNMNRQANDILMQQQMKAAINPQPQTTGVMPA